MNAFCIESKKKQIKKIQQKSKIEMDKWSVYLALVKREGVKVFKFKQQKQSLDDTIQTGKGILSSIKNSEIDEYVSLHRSKLDNKLNEWGRGGRDLTKDKLSDLDGVDGNRVLFTEIDGQKRKLLYVRMRREGKIVSGGRKNRGPSVSEAAHIQMYLSPRARAPRAKIDKVWKCRKMKNKCRYVSRVNKEDDKGMECQKQNKQCLLMSVRLNYPKAEYLTRDNWMDIWTEVHAHTVAEA